MHPNEVVSLIKSKIPITNELGFEIDSWDGESLSLSAPFDKNKNHHNTAFGGSLAMSAIVSGYCMTFMVLDDELGEGWMEDYTLVIRNFSCDYLRPVKGKICPVSKAPKEDMINFISTLKRKHKARLNVSTVIENGRDQLRAQAVYVAYKNE